MKNGIYNCPCFFWVLFRAFFSCSRLFQNKFAFSIGPLPLRYQYLSDFAIWTLIQHLGQFYVWLRVRGKGGSFIYPNHQTGLLIDHLGFYLKVCWLFLFKVASKVQDVEDACQIAQAMVIEMMCQFNLFGLLGTMKICFPDKPREEQPSLVKYLGGHQELSLSRPSCITCFRWYCSYLVVISVL